MPAHIGIAERLKVPLASLALKLVKLRYITDSDNIRRPNRTSMKYVAEHQEKVRQARERPFTSYTGFRQVVDLFRPDGTAPQELRDDWDQNLSVGGYVDELVKISFELDTIKGGMGIVQKTAAALKRIEVTRPNDGIEIVWSCA